MIARRPCLFVGLVLAFLGAATTSPARPGDARLWLRWKGAQPGAANLANLVLLTPAGGSQSVAVASDDRGTGEARFDPLPAGIAGCELRSIQGEVLKRWDVPLSADLTTVAEIDLTTGILTVDPAHPDPFGDTEGWGPEELRALPGTAASAAFHQSTVTRTDAAPIIDGGLPPLHARIYTKEYRLENDVVAVTVPLGTPPPHADLPRTSMVTGRPERTGIAVFLSQATGGGALGQVEGSLTGHLGFLGPVEGHAVFQGLSYPDAGPLGIADDRLPGNKLEGLETRAVFYLRPTPSGLVRLDFYASGESRRHFLQEFRLDSAHSPRQDQADLFSSAGYDLNLGRADLSLEASYGRAFMETGDGRAFDSFKLYALGDPRDTQDNSTAFSSDSMYWRPPGIAPPHLYNYYLRDLTTSRNLRAEGRVRLAPEAPLRVGIDLRATTYRWYEHLDPISAGREGMSQGGGQYASYMGYTLDGKNRVESGDLAPRRPVWAAAYLSQRASLGPVAGEAGLRATHFRSDQRPLKNPSDPLGSESDTVLNVSRLGEFSSRWDLDPRLGLYAKVGSTNFWCDGGSTRRDPPYEALYYSPTLLHFYAERARQGHQLPDQKEEKVFGNPDLRPETEWSGHVGIAREFSPGLALRASARLAQVKDTWVIKPYRAGIDTLNYYQNQGDRRERSVHLGLSLRASKRTSVRVLYDLSKVETNVVEPAPLYRALLRPGLPAEGTGVRETSPLVPVWRQSGEPRDYFPSLFDRRHRFSLSVLGRLGSSEVATGKEATASGTTLAATVRAASGAPYTPTYVEAEGLMLYNQGALGALAPGRPLPGNGINSARMPWTWQLDLSLRRQTGLFGGSLGILVECLNLTGHKNVRTVYGATGEADDDGWLKSPVNPQDPNGPTHQDARSGNYASAYQDRLDDPLHYDEGRTFRAALSFSY